MEAKLDGRKLILELELAERPQPSSTGKTLIAYSTGGFVSIDDGYKVNLTVTAPGK